MIDRKILGYFSTIFMLGLAYALVIEKQFVILSIVSIVYLGLIFGIDKFKIDFKNKKVELKDENQDS
jgi:hypothetical protein